ncbi:MAG: NAD(P)-dependent oxidoreductase [Promethearchaeota archaeon]
MGKVDFLSNKNKVDNFIKDKNILFIRLGYYIDRSFLEMARKLEYLCTPTTGLNHIDLNYIEERGIKIISLRNESDFLSNIRATPEHTFGLVLSLLRNYNYSFLKSRKQTWDRDKYWGHEIYGKKIGIIGFGRIGKLLAKYFNAFDSQISFYDIDINIDSVYNAKRANSIELLIKKSDIIILCVSYNVQNDKFFDKRYIDLLKNKYFVNTSRGELIDEDYLIKKIEEDHFKGIALDVISDEINYKNNLKKFLELAEKKKIIITPHIAGATFESIQTTEEFIVEQLITKIMKKEKIIY